MFRLHAINPSSLGRRENPAGRLWVAQALRSNPTYAFKAASRGSVRGCSRLNGNIYAGIRELLRSHSADSVVGLDPRVERGNVEPLSSNDL